MALHSDPVVDRAMRANIGHGFHFFDPDSNRFHRSRPVTGFIDRRERYAYVVIRLGYVILGGHTVQVPHSRVVRVSLSKGETDWVTSEGKPTSEMVRGVYVNNGEKHEYRTNAQAIRAARVFADPGLPKRERTIKALRRKLAALDRVPFGDQSAAAKHLIERIRTLHSRNGGN